MCDRVVSEDPFLIVYCLDKYKTQKMCDEAVDDCLAAMKFIPDWFCTSKMIKKLFAALYADGNIILTKILVILTLMIVIIMKMTLKLLFMSDFWLGIVNLKNVMHLKKS